MGAPSKLTVHIVDVLHSSSLCRDIPRGKRFWQFYPPDNYTRILPFQTLITWPKQSSRHIIKSYVHSQKANSLPWLKAPQKFPCDKSHALSSMRLMRNETIPSLHEMFLFHLRRFIIKKMIQDTTH